MERLRISTSTELVRIPTDDIMFVRAQGNYSEVYLNNGRLRTLGLQLGKLDEMFRLLKNNFFVRVGKSLIVNRNYVYLINLTTEELQLYCTQLDKPFSLSPSRDSLKALKALMEQEGDNA